jgi:hypothetical protein
MEEGRREGTDKRRKDRRKKERKEGRLRHEGRY